MDYNNRHFMIFSVIELPNIDFTQINETSTETVRIRKVLTRMRKC